MKPRWSIKAIIVIMAVVTGLWQGQARAELPRPRSGIASAKLRHLLSRSPRVRRSIKTPGSPWRPAKNHGLVKNQSLVGSKRLAAVGKMLKSGIRATGLGWMTQDHVWMGSSMSLGTAELVTLSEKATPFIRGMRWVGLAGAAGLTYTASRDLQQARSANERMDAVGDLAWGVEGLLYLAKPTSQLLGTVAQHVGIVGGFCQTAVGCRRIYQGIKQRNREKITLGALDVAGGLTWLAWDALAWENPLFIASYAGFMVAREAYDNRAELKAFGKKMGGRLRCAADYCRRQINRGVTRLGQLGDLLRPGKPSPVHPQ